MNLIGNFPAPASWLAGAHLARVVSVKDPANLGRVQVRLLAADPDGEALVWARVAVPYAGDKYGAFLIPGIDEEVLVVFTANDAGHPIVVGALWNGKTALPESLTKDAVDRWTLTGPNGTRIAIVEEASGQEKVEISTPGGATATLTDASGGEIRLKVGTNKVVMGQSGIAIQTANEFSVKAATIVMQAGQFDVKTPLATFSLAVDCKTLTSTMITSSTYAPGIGNVW